MISLKPLYTLFTSTSLWKPLLFVFILFAFTSCFDEAEDPTAEQLKLDEAKIKAYISEQNLGEFKRTPSGVYYKVTKPGNGTRPKSGDLVWVHYTLFNLAGKQLETSVNNPNTDGAPYNFTLGIGQVIRGWDVGIAQLDEASSAILLIPSPLAYGSRHNGPDMPAHSVLRFDVELVAIN